MYQRINFLHLYFITEIMCVKMRHYLISQLAVVYKIHYPHSRLYLIKRHNHSIHTVCYLAFGSGIVSDDHRLAKYLRFTNSNTLSLIDTGLRINVACLDIG